MRPYGKRSLLPCCGTNARATGGDGSSTSTSTTSACSSSTTNEECAMPLVWTLEIDPIRNDDARARACISGVNCKLAG